MTRPKKILNSATDAVEEFLQGLLLQYPNTLVRVQDHPVVMLRNSIDDKNHVQLLSGGGSGHEPSHAGWIGQGMLAGAICGGIFASPSVANVLAAIQSIDSSSDVLLIVKNYTGDRLNFGMAVEQANIAQPQRNVRMVVVADDCALPRTKGITGARGVAGTVLVHKIAGAAAAAGKLLDEVVRLAHCVSRRIGTLGIALGSVTVPGATETNARLDDDNTIEIGLGIHGEAGLKQSKLLTADEMAREMVATIQSYGRVKDEEDDTIVPFLQAGDEVCVLVNNLGGTSNFEMSILARSCIQLLETEKSYGVKVTRVLVGSYMTSFDMHGASLTILNLTPELTAWLDAPTTAPAWAQCESWTTTRPSATSLPNPLTKKETAVLPTPPLVNMDNFTVTVAAMLMKATENLAAAEPLLTQYDTIVGDGDCGITMQRGATAVREKINDLPTSHPVPLLAALADTVSASMGGTSGVLLELMFRKMSSTLARCPDSISPADMALAWQAGVEAVQLYGGATVGSRTMLDALIPAAAELVANGNVHQAAVCARKGADGTARMKVASAGRSNYLSEETLEGTPDPGAVAVAIILESVAGAL